MKLNVICERVAVDSEGTLFVCPDRRPSSVYNIWLKHSPAKTGGYPEWEWQRPAGAGGGCVRLTDCTGPALVAVVETILTAGQAKEAAS